MIEINNLTAVPVNEEFLRKVAKKVLEGENKKGADLSIALVNQDRIRELNKKYKRKNRVTDVLAFSEHIPYVLDRAQKDFVRWPDRELGLGEIIICPQEVKKNAKKFWETFETELARVLIHGLLHLLGYNHDKSGKFAEEMKKKEEYYLSQI